MTSGGSAEKLTIVAMPAATLWLRMSRARLTRSLEKNFSTIWYWVSFGHNRMGDLPSISSKLEIYDQHNFASPTRKSFEYRLFRILLIKYGGSNIPYTRMLPKSKEKLVYGNAQPVEESAIV
ncbi:hypothetical protein PoB_005018500 [Plakobranchus ocellatus]|uniref:Uncharacterized protein n=1 Tax=Plakobranchus ocellatus TaxID=259542 RepID=A0AAV4BT96_9GAST|nr:hypothetical protein PoB_005018500 [Plakobranchus ocellatus]